MKTKQIVVRTRKSENLYQFNYYARDEYENLHNKLSQGFHVVMCNKIGDELEYILEIEEEDLK